MLPNVKKGSIKRRVWRDKSDGKPTSILSPRKRDGTKHKTAQSAVKEKKAFTKFHSIRRKNKMKHSTGIIGDLAEEGDYIGDNVIWPQGRMGRERVADNLMGSMYVSYVGPHVTSSSASSWGTTPVNTRGSAIHRAQSDNSDTLALDEAPGATHGRERLISCDYPVDFDGAFLVPESSPTHLNEHAVDSQDVAGPLDGSQGVYADAELLTALSDILRVSQGDHPECADSVPAKEDSSTLEDVFLQQGEQDEPTVHMDSPIPEELFSQEDDDIIVEGSLHHEDDHPLDSSPSHTPRDHWGSSSSSSSSSSSLPYACDTPAFTSPGDIERASVGMLRMVMMQLMEMRNTSEGMDLQLETLRLCRQAERTERANLLRIGMSSKRWAHEMEAGVRLSTQSQCRPSDLRSLYRTENDFVYASSTYAKIIINELTLDHSKKTILPVQLGGIAGGRKYVKNGILYKFATDTMISRSPQYWMYGGTSPADELAIKAAGKELRFAQALSMACPFSIRGGHQLRFPLMACIDYCGYRVMAISLLPIEGDESIVYGSPDGGTTMHADVPEVSSAMEEAAERLGLAVHQVCGVSLAMPGDIEVHRGTDGHYYVLDFARLMPPEAPVDADPTEWGESTEDAAISREEVHPRDARAVFYRLLRTGLLLKHKMFQPCGISPDVFTGWGADDPERLQQEVSALGATRYMLDTLIPTFAHHFPKRCSTRRYLSWVNAMTMSKRKSSILSDKCNTWVYAQKMLRVVRLVQSFQAYGCNTRYIGILRRYSRDAPIRDLILAEACARIGRHLIGEQMRQRVDPSGVPSEEPFKKAVHDHLRIALGCESDASSYFYRHVMRKLLLRHYPHILSPEERISFIDLRCAHPLKDGLDLRLYCLLLTEKVGVRLSDRCLESLWKCAPSKATGFSDFVILREDIKSVNAVIKRGFRGRLGCALFFMDQGIKSENMTASRHYLRLSRDMFLEAMQSAPYSPFMSYQYGICLAELGKIAEASNKREKSDYLFELCFEQMDASLELRPLQDALHAYVGVLADYSEALNARGKHFQREAKRYRSRALKLQEDWSRKTKQESPEEYTIPYRNAFKI